MREHSSQCRYDPEIQPLVEKAWLLLTGEQRSCHGALMVELAIDLPL